MIEEVTDASYVKLNAEDTATPRNRFSYNVVLTLVLTGLSGCADSVWANTTLAAYLYIKTNGSNSKVGYVEAVWGAATLFTALPIGYGINSLPKS